jgi:hypothetical protein
VGDARPNPLAEQRASDQRELAWCVWDMLVELVDVVDYLDDVPKEFEISDLEKVIESKKKEYSRKDLVKILNRLPKHVKMIERKQERANHERHKNTRWMKLGGTK